MIDHTGQFMLICETSGSVGFKANKWKTHDGQSTHHEDYRVHDRLLVELTRAEARMLPSLLSLKLRVVPALE